MTSGLSRVGGRGRRWLVAQCRPGPLDDPAAVVLALAVVAGASVAAPVPVLGAAGGAGLALLSRRVVAVWVAGFLLASALAAQAWAGMAPPERAPFAGTVTLARDPESVVGGWRVEVVAGDRRLEAQAHGAAAGALAARAAGHRVEVVGRVEPIDDAPWLTARHVVGRLVVERIEGWDEGGPVARIANGVRSVLRRGARSLPAEQRALFLGFVLGDDRGQPVEVADDFDAAGLQHLLVVSGQNVAFLLVVTGPLLRRIGLRSRLVATVALLALFATITRFEPSVLRATVMAGLACVGATLGRRASGVRLLSLAVAALVVADPFLVHAVGFRLSVAASAGILLLTRPLEAVIPGPRAIVLPLAVTLAAQVGVAPVLIPAFGPMPVAAVPANLLAEPVAGLVMMWGCSAGVVAGLVGGPFAAVLHWPTRVGLGWVVAVARWAAELPLGRVDLPVMVLLAGAVAAAVLLGRRVGSGRRGVLVVGLAVVALIPSGVSMVAGRLDEVPHGRVELAGATLWRGPAQEMGEVAVLVLDGDASAARLLADLRGLGVEQLDLVIARSGGSRSASTIEVLRRRVTTAEVWAPTGHEVPGAVTPPKEVLEVPGLRVEVRRVAPRLDVVVDLDDDRAAEGDPGRGGVPPRQ
jgi:competence protein ComEC